MDSVKHAIAWSNLDNSYTDTWCDDRVLNEECVSLWVETTCIKCLKAGLPESGSSTNSVIKNKLYELQVKPFNDELHSLLSDSPEGETK